MIDQALKGVSSEKLAEFCRQRGIRKLSVFGSAVREDFDPERSDVDVLAEFKEGALKGVGWHYFGYGEELAQIIGRKVDFCSKLQPEIMEYVRPELMTIYEEV